MSACRVWIDPGCIQCSWCQHLESRVFIAGDAGTEIRGSARCDGVSDANRNARVALRPGLLDAGEIAYLHFIADGCPVSVIRIDNGQSAAVDAITGLAVVQWKPSQPP